MPDDLDVVLAFVSRELRRHFFSRIFSGSLDRLGVGANPCRTFLESILFGGTLLGAAVLLFASACQKEKGGAQEESRSQKTRGQKIHR